MISVSDNYKTAAKAPVKILQASITIDGNTFSSSDILVNLTKEELGYYFSTVTKSLTFTLLGTDFNLLNKRAQVLIELKHQDSFESCDLGSFEIYDQTIDFEKKISTFKAFDKIGSMGKVQYNHGELSFNCSIRNLAAQIADRFGLELACDDLPNLDYIIKEDLYTNINNVTYRDILAEIAGATCSIVKTTDTNLILSKLQNETREELNYDNLRKLKIEPLYGPINSIVLSRTPQEDNIVVVDQESIDEFGLTEVKLANNEILDDDRELFAQPILDHVDGFSFSPFEATTEGHGWHECGDRIVINSEASQNEVIITSVKLTVDGGIKEIIKGIRPTDTSTNYALAGGISKTIYNTEIKVDKQNQQINSIVSEQASLENKVNENYTSVTQNISNVVTSVQNSGGNNLIKNSAMFAKDADGNPISWTLSSGGQLTSIPSADASAHGSLSGQIIILSNKTIKQEVIVVADNDDIQENDKTYYTFSCKIKKPAIGSGYIKLDDKAGGIRELRFNTGDELYYADFSIPKILPKSTNISLEIYGSENSSFTITDMMLSVGEYKTQWQQANGEFANTQVQIDIDGVDVRSNNIAGTYTSQTPQGFSSYLNNSLRSSLTNEMITAPKLTLEKEIYMPPIKVVAQNDGWAFVPTN